MCREKRFYGGKSPFLIKKESKNEKKDRRCTRIVGFQRAAKSVLQMNSKKYGSFRKNILKGSIFEILNT